MITSLPTQEMLVQWKALWQEYRPILKPNRVTAEQLLAYLQENYVLTPLEDKDACAAVFENVIQNKPSAEKLPVGTVPLPKAFYLENAGSGQKFFAAENIDPHEIWGGSVRRIFVGIDMVTGWYMVEGSTLLHDELCAFQGLDARDLENYVCVASYVNALKRFDLLHTVVEQAEP